MRFIFSTLQRIRKDIQETNWQRKDSQHRAGTALSKLENDWAMLVSKNYEIEEALLRKADKWKIRKKKLGNCLYCFSKKNKILSISKRMENERENLRAGRHVKKQFGFWLCKKIFFEISTAKDMSRINLGKVFIRFYQRIFLKFSIWPVWALTPEHIHVNQFGHGGTNVPPIFRIALKNYFTSIASD